MHPDIPGRRPLQPASLAAALAGAGVGWCDPSVVVSTGSTNADVMAAARAGAAEGRAVIADEQTAGRGRLQREWRTPRGGALALSVLLRPSPAASTWGWVPLLAGVAVAEALRAATGVAAEVKWPNDVVVDGSARDGGPGPRKLGGILVERVPTPAPGVVVGIGVNVDLQAAELPTAAATSIAAEAGRVLPREELAAQILSALGARYRQWAEAAGDADRCPLAAEYAAACCTIGREVRLSLPTGDAVAGAAVGVDTDGRLLVERAGEVTAYSSGDVVHARHP